MNQKRKYNLVPVSAASITLAFAFGFVWASCHNFSSLTYAEFQALLRCEVPNGCRIDSIALMCGDPNIDVKLSDKSIRRLVVTDEQKVQMVTILNERNIPIVLLAAH